jgi:hypothetical protein
VACKELAPAEVNGAANGLRGDTGAGVAAGAKGGGAGEGEWEREQAIPFLSPIVNIAS